MESYPYENAGRKRQSSVGAAKANTAGHHRHSLDDRNCFFLPGVRTGLSWVPVLFSLIGSGVQVPGFCGAVGFTPKSQTYKFISLGLSISTRAYSPGPRGSAGVTLTQSPGPFSALAVTKAW